MTDTRRFYLLWIIIMALLLMGCRYTKHYPQPAAVDLGIARLPVMDVFYNGDIYNENQ